MSKSKQKWHSVSIPGNLFKRIKAILGFVADESLAEYARQAIQTRLRQDEIEREEEIMLREEIGERLRERPQR